jgi:hypothetical protein
MSSSIEYPIVLAEFEFHGEQFQVWNNYERLWLVHKRLWVNPDELPEWEVMYIE